MPTLDLGQVVGPQGPQGATGPQGPQGVKGEQAPVINDLTTGGVTDALSAEMGKQLENTKADLTLSNLSNYQKALRNIGGRPNRNLLDNAYFKGGGSQQGGGQFPINQRGQTSYNASGGTIDRWVLGSGPAIGGVAVTLSADGLVLNGNTQYQYTLIRQTLSAPVLSGQTYTLSVLLANGTLVQASGQATVEATTWCNLQITPTCYIRAVGLNKVELVETAETPPIKALKMEAGDHQTLAYQDESGAWQLFETPDYGEELDKCLFYLEIQNIPINAYIPANVWNGISGECNFCLQYANKRITPTISFSGGGRFVSNSASQVNLTSFFTRAATPSAAGISATLSENLTGGGVGWVDSLGQVIISAEL